MGIAAIEAITVEAVEMGLKKTCEVTLVTASN